MFGFVGVLSRTEQDLPAFSGSSIQFEKFKFHSKFKIFPEKEDGQTFSCSDGSIVKILGLFFSASKPPKSLNNFEEIADGAFTAFAATPNEFRIYADPCGWRSIYFREEGSLLYITSNIRYLREYLGLHLEPVPERSIDFLCTSFIPGLETLTKDVFELPMGNVLEWKGQNKLTIRDYCRYDTLPKVEKSLPETASELHAICLKNTENIIQTSGKKECTVFLSGGLDSTCALSSAIDIFGLKNVETISVHFGSDLPNENKYIDEAVKYFGCNHRYLEISPDSFLSEMDNLYKWIDDPIGDPVVMPNYMMNRAIDPKEQLVITGEGGDPCFGGPKNVFMSNSLQYSDMYCNGSNDDFLATCYLESFKRAYDDAAQLSQFSEPTFGRRLDELQSNLNIHLTNQRWESFLDRLLFANKHLKSNSLILPKVQKTTQPFFRYSLSPLFSRTVIEFCARTPIQIKYPSLQEKFILKKAFLGKIPQSIIDREKSGMRVPLRFWKGNKIKAFNREVLLRKNKALTSRFFNIKEIKALLKHPRPRQGLKSWMLSTFILTAKNLYEPKS